MDFAGFPAPARSIIRTEIWNAVERVRTDCRIIIASDFGVSADLDMADRVRHRQTKGAPSPDERPDVNRKKAVCRRPACDYGTARRQPGLVEGLERHHTLAGSRRGATPEHTTNVSKQFEHSTALIN
jgi:hypothetical protein